MAQQLTFELPVIPALGRDDFYISASNSAAVAAVENWENWQNGKMLLVGDRGAGKTHLAHVWASLAKGIVVPAQQLDPQNVAGFVQSNPRIAIEDADQIAGNATCEQALFHLHNLLAAEGGHLLITARQSPARWHLSLPDLASRLQGASLVSLEPPDDPLLAALMVKLFADRQLAVAPPVISYLVTRMQRSFSGAQVLVDALDRAALTARSGVTRKIAAQVLDQLAQDSE